ncbi:endonuclease/exonuclease/phosphatase family protein [Actinomycetospora soli]|uniref:endonuclease/exonuclease/phosphatase family protein n=1 Tax=Actinomycetospora soli TaxID=2893887 RepID=UPI001E36A8BE|nr:endonuclease/exonuclease/phosphatase family protein [Actinomycetospora soli]MCD2186922.1 endonuclease/exonuclease/phosphatase family protein [Actinomycetospora soli]
MRLATWNVLHACSPDDGRVDLDRFAAAVRALDVDVLALQEVDRGQVRSGRADLAAVAAEALGAVDHRFVPALVGAPGDWSAPGEQDTGPGDAADDATGALRAGTPDHVDVVAARPGPTTPAYGVALVSRVPVSAWRVVRVPPLRRPLPLLLGRPPRPVVVHDEPRVAVAATLAPAATEPLTVACTHLSFVPGWNLVQLRRLVRALDPGRLVVAGDLNTGPRRAAAASGLTSLAPGATFPVAAPRRQLDHVLGRGVGARDARVRRLDVSDHRALEVTVD